MDVSLAHFVGQVMTNPMLAITALLTIGVILVNGWTDAPNAIATCVIHARDDSGGRHCHGARCSISSACWL